MTEAEWMAREDVNALLGRLRDHASERKRGLFAAACCRQVWQLLEDKRSREAVEVAERFVDGAATDGELIDAEMAAEAAADALTAGGRDAATSSAARSAYCVTCFNSEWAHADAGWDFARSAASYAADATRTAGTAINQLALLRCVFGAPFPPVTLDPAWLIPAIMRMAQAAYEGRGLPRGELDPARLAALADALEEVGASDEPAVHLRSPSPHVRGCWAVDVLLGKS